MSLKSWIDSLFEKGVPEEASEKETRRIETLKYLSDIQRSQINVRQKLEWRVIFTALAFYVLIPVGVNRGDISLPKEWLLVAVLYFFFSSIIVAFLCRIQKSHNSNKRASIFAEDLLWKSIGEDDPSKIFHGKPGVKPKNAIEHRALWYFLLQLLMLSFFAVMSFLAATFWSKYWQAYF